MTSPASFVYVYAITSPRTASSLAGLAGLEPDAPPRLIAHGGLAAVASDVPGDVYSEEALRERLVDLAWVGEKGIAHERVVETCFLAGPTLPLRFGTIFRDDASVAELLERSAERLERILADLTGKVEFGLRVHVDRPRFEAAVAADVAARAAPGAEGAGAGRKYLERKKAAATARRSSSEALAEALAEIYAAHAGAALAAVRQPVAGEGSLLLKAAFLVPASERQAFEAASRHTAEARRPQGIDVVLTGAWPPYAFVPPLEPRERTS